MAPFVCQLLTEMHAVMGVKDSPVVDHLCYRAATLQEYLELKAVLAAHGVLLVDLRYAASSLQSEYSHHLRMQDRRG